MGVRARSIIFWPGMTEDIERVRQRCRDCTQNAPSQPPLPASPSTPPSTPFEKVYADFFDCAGQHYLVVGDRLSGWCDVFRSPHGSPQAGSEGLITCLRNYFSRFGVPEELSSDGGPEFISKTTEDFLSRWGVHHRLSSAYNPQSNGRAEVAVKSAKRLLRSNTGSVGALDTDCFLRAMMQLRNTPDPDCNISPAQIVFGRPLRDAFAFSSRLEKFSNNNVRPVWREAWQLKEEALRQRFHHSAEARDEHSRSLPALELGDRCYIQNQTGNHPKRWHRSGTVVEVHGHDSYTLKVDGTGRVTRRNRRYLRQFRPATVDITHRKQMNREASPAPKCYPSSGQKSAVLNKPCSSGTDNKMFPLPPPFASSSPPVSTPVPAATTQSTLAPALSMTVPPSTTQCSPASPLKIPGIDVTAPAPPGAHETPEADNIPVTDSATQADTFHALSRTRRNRKPPARYEPETGKWA